MTAHPTLWATSAPIPHISLQGAFADRLTQVVSSNRVSTRGVSRIALDKQGAAALWLLECLYQGFSCVPQAAIALPRSTGDYRSGRLGAVPHGYDVVTRVLDAAEELGWVCIIPGYQSSTPGSGHVTRVMASGGLLEHFERLGICWQDLKAPSPDGLVILAMGKKGKNRRTVDRMEEPQVASMQDNLQRINEFLLSQCIHLNCSDDLLIDAVDGITRHSGALPIDANSTIKDSPTTVNFQSVALCRIFAHNSLGKGGRFYRGWWQHIRSEYRERILINGSVTVECDYSGMALVCLYAREGQSMDSGDAYDIELNYKDGSDPRRKVVKRYVNAIINDEDGRFRIDKASLKLIGLTAKELRRRVDRRHRKIKHMFRTGVGLELQYVDSKIAEQVMLRFVEIGEVCLPVHDSFIVRRGLEERLLHVMQEEFERETGTTIQIKSAVEAPGGLGTPSRATQPSPRMPLFESIREGLQEHFNSYAICIGYLNSWLDQSPTEHDSGWLGISVNNRDSGNGKDREIPRDETSGGGRVLSVHVNPGDPLFITRRELAPIQCIAGAGVDRTDRNRSKPWLPSGRHLNGDAEPLVVSFRTATDQLAGFGAANQAR